MVAQKRDPKNTRAVFEATWREWANDLRLLAHSTDDPKLWDEIKAARVKLIGLVDKVAQDLYTPVLPR